MPPYINSAFPINKSKKVKIVLLVWTNAQKMVILKTNSDKHRELGKMDIQRGYTWDEVGW